MFGSKYFSARYWQARLFTRTPEAVVEEAQAGFVYGPSKGEVRRLRLWTEAQEAARIAQEAADAQGLDAAFKGVFPRFDEEKMRRNAENRIRLLLLA